MRAILAVVLAVLIATGIGVAVEAAAGPPTYGPAGARFRADFPGFPVVRTATVDGAEVTATVAALPSGDYGVWTARPPGRRVPPLAVPCPARDFCGGWTGYAPLQASRARFVFGGKGVQATEIPFAPPGRRGDELVTASVVVDGVRFAIAALGPQRDVAAFISSIRLVR